MTEAALLDSSPSLFAPGGPVSAAAIADLRAHPGFPNAIRTFGSGMLALYRGNRLLNMLINDRGRMVIGYLSLYLHEGGAPDGRGSGFGVGQLKALCAAAGLASPGRTAAMLALMRMSGHIASASAAEDKRRHILVPTEKLRAAHRDRWECVVAGLREVRPDAAAAFNLDDPEFVAAYVRVTADHFLAGFRLIEFAPDMELFLDRNAGLMVLFTILLAGKGDDTVPPRRPVPLSISAHREPLRRLAAACAYAVARRRGCGPDPARGRGPCRGAAAAGGSGRDLLCHRAAVRRDVRLRGARRSRRGK